MRRTSLKHPSRSSASARFARPASAAALTGILLFAAPVAQAAEQTNTATDDAASSSITLSADSQESSASSRLSESTSASTSAVADAEAEVEDKQADGATANSTASNGGTSSSTSDASSSSTGETGASDAQQQTETAEAEKPTTTMGDAQLSSSGIELSWTTEGPAVEHRVYRKSSNDTSYTVIATLDGTARSYTDANVEPATTYRYYVRTYYLVGSKRKSVKSGKAAIESYLATPAITALSKKASAKTMKVSWERVPLAGSYQIDYATDRLFQSKKTLTISASKTSTKISGLKKNQLYYVRIRAYAQVGSSHLYSRYTHSQTADAPAETSLSYVHKTVTETTTTWKIVKKVKKKKVEKNGKTTYVTVYRKVKKNGRTIKVKVYETTRKKVVTKTKKDILFEVRSQAGQQLYGYDTVQGGTSDGTYLYYVLYNRILESQGKPCCLIAKFKASNLKLTKLSDPLDINHANSLAYDTANRRLVAAHCRTHVARLSYINPKTLKVTQYVDAADPLASTADAQTASVPHIAAIAYCAERKQYVAYDSKKKGFVVYDKQMEPVKRITPSLKSKQTSQTVLATEDYILLGVSPKSGVEGGNQLLVYDWDGNYITAIQLGASYELENAYFYQGHLYVTFYAAYYPAAGSGESISRNNYVALVNGV